MSTREVAKKAVQRQISLAALKLFQEKGFESATIEDISTQVGMSVRTFFRYFRTKEDVLLGPARAFSDAFLEELGKQLQTNDLWTSLENALGETARTCEKLGDADQSLQLQQIVASTPNVLARQLEVVERLQLQATEISISSCAQAEALGRATTDAIVRSAFACLRVVQCEYSDVQGAQALKALHTLMGRLRPAILAETPE